MSHGYDLFGWYVGVVPEGTKRSTDIAPANLSTSRTPGDTVANWTGRAWVDRVYSIPPDVTEQRDFETAKRHALQRLDAEMAEQTAKRFGDEAAPIVAAVLPLLFDLWRSIDNAARTPNAGMTWLLAARQTYAQAKQDLKAATNRRQIGAVFPVDWPA